MISVQSTRSFNAVYKFEVGDILTFPDRHGCDVKAVAVRVHDSCVTFWTTTPVGPYLNSLPFIDYGAEYCTLQMDEYLNELWLQDFPTELKALMVGDLRYPHITELFGSTHISEDSNNDAWRYIVDRSELRTPTGDYAVYLQPVTGKHGRTAICTIDELGNPSLRSDYMSYSIQPVFTLYMG